MSGSPSSKSSKSSKISKIKFCGFTREADAVEAVAAGADAIGLNFAPLSPRNVDIATAAAIARRVGGSVVRVGVFVDQSAAEVRRVLDEVPLDLLQFHGDEPAGFCRGFDMAYTKVFRVQGPFDARAAAEAYPDACCLMLDTFVSGASGGTGQRFDMAHWPQRPHPQRLVVAGGLTPDNVAGVVRSIEPWAVDVASGVEDGVKGVKSAAKMRRFVRAVRDG